MKMDDRECAVEQRISRLEAFQESDVARLVRQAQELDRRFDQVNEFRAAMNDLLTNMMSRAEYNGSHQSLIQMVDSLNRLIGLNTSRLDKIEGKSQGLGAIAGWILAAGGLIGTVVVGWISVHHS